MGQMVQDLKIITYYAVARLAWILVLIMGKWLLTLTLGT